MFLLITTTLITVQLLFWVGIFNKIIPIDNNFTENTYSDPVSIIICSKNDLANLKTTIPTILNQHHKNKEILIMDDYSTDNTEEYITSIEKKNGLLKYYKVTQNIQGKKAALQQGINLASTKTILLTDADCVPASKKWVTQMLKQLADNDIVLGYSPYKTNGTLISKWMHFEGWITGIQYLSYCAAGIPYMGVGRNMMYNKHLIKEHNWEKHSDLVSGDDDLLINDVSNRDNTTYCICPATFVYTNPLSNWGQYFKQKTRHMSTSHRYQLSHRVLLGGYASSQILMYFFWVVLLIIGQWKWLVITYVGRLLLILPIVYKLHNLLEAEFKLLTFPIYDFLQAIYYLVFSFAPIFPTKQQATWKNQ